MSSQEQNSKNNTEDETSGEPPLKMIKFGANQRTPISILTELCVQKKIAPPVFTEINDAKIQQKSEQSYTKFFMEVIACNKKAFGKGSSKKQAKHDAAQNLLQKLHREDDDDDDDDDDIIDKSFNVDCDYVTQLLNFCVQRNYHKPEFLEIEAFGASHCPTFTFQCKLSSICTKSSANSKKMAKQKAAKACLDIFKEIYPDTKKKIALIGKTQHEINDEINKKITTYMELKMLNKTELMGTSISKRHDFFVNYKHEQIAIELRKVLDENVEDKIKLCNLLKILDIYFGKASITSDESGLKKFELLIDDDEFSEDSRILVANNEDELNREILNYFTIMLNDESNTEQLNEHKTYKNVDLTFIPIE